MSIEPGSSDYASMRPPEVADSEVLRGPPSADFGLVAEVYGLDPGAPETEVREAVKLDPDTLITAYASEHRDSRIDAMTGLLNRKSFDERFLSLSPEKLIEQDVEALFLFDVDNFKRVNETEGYSEGDRLLVAVAQKLRATDEVYRFGGDEYAAVIRRGDLRGNEETSPEKLLELLEMRFREETERVFAQEFDQHPDLNLSIAVVLASDLREELERDGLSGDELTPHQMFAAANRALKVAKKENESERQSQQPSLIRFWRAIGRAAFRASGDYDERTMP